MDRIAYTLPEAARIAGVAHRTRIFDAARRRGADHQEEPAAPAS